MEVRNGTSSYGNIWCTEQESYLCKLLLWKSTLFSYQVAVRETVKGKFLGLVSFRNGSLWYFQNVHVSNKILDFLCAFPDFWKKISPAFKQLCLLFVNKGKKLKETSQRHCNATENVRRRNDHIYRGEWYIKWNTFLLDIRYKRQIILFTLIKKLISFSEV